jgi:uncharacterized protein (TIGR03083 family)
MGQTTQSAERVLRQLQDQLANLVVNLSEPELALPAYPSEWTIAQVLSHLGSASEIFTRFIHAGLAGVAGPDPSEFQAIWDAWDAKTPGEQARDSLAVGEAFLSLLAGIDDERKAAWRLEMFGAERDLGDVLGMRISENALHTWDVAVAMDPTATIGPIAVERIIDSLGMLVQYTAVAPATPIEVSVRTTAPSREFTLRASDRVELIAGAATARATLTLPAEAFIRLAYGRLDADHSPPVDAAGITVDELRAIFPGP